MIKSSLPVQRVGETANAIAARTASAIPLSAPRPLTAGIDRELSQQRVFAWMLSLLAVLGFGLAALGLYGLIAQATIERRREFGIRLALGAAGGDIVRLVARYAVAVSSLGVLLGLGLSYFGAELSGACCLASRHSIRKRMSQRLPRCYSSWRWRALDPPCGRFACKRSRCSGPSKHGRVHHEMIRCRRPTESASHVMTRRFLVYMLVIAAAVLAVAGLIHLGAARLSTQGVHAGRCACAGHRRLHADARQRAASAAAPHSPTDCHRARGARVWSSLLAAWGNRR